MITEMELGHRIRDLRKKKGLSQLSFAADIDAPQSTIALWETGEGVRRTCKRVTARERSTEGCSD